MPELRRRGSSAHHTLTAHPPCHGEFPRPLCFIRRRPTAAAELRLRPEPNSSSSAHFRRRQHAGRVPNDSSRRGGASSTFAARRRGLDRRRRSRGRRRRENGFKPDPLTPIRPVSVRVQPSNAQIRPVKPSFDFVFDYDEFRLVFRSVFDQFLTHSSYINSNLNGLAFLILFS
jgi:hypothetical protein